MNTDCKNQMPHAECQTRVLIAIPARLSSTRLPEKPLAMLGDFTLVEHVVMRALAVKNTLLKNKKISEVHICVATDDERIAQLARQKGAAAAMTSPNLPSGTDRIYAALQNYPEFQERDLVVNIQGDEPFISEDDVVSLCEEMLINSDSPMGTLAFKRFEISEFIKSNVVKVVLSESGNALYFSRAPVPWPREIFGATAQGLQNAIGAQSNKEFYFLHHMGVYAYRCAALKKFAAELKPSYLETLESLEQLRAVEAGWKIRVVQASHEPFGIDTFEDLEKARERLAK